MFKFKRNEDNKYRTFDETDIAMLLRIKILRNRGFTLSQIKKIFLSGDLNVTSELYQSKIDDCDRQFQQLKRERAALQHELEQLNDDETKYVIRPAMYIIIYLGFQSIIDGHEFKASLRQWLESVEFGNVFFRYSRKEEMPCLEIGVSVSEDVAEENNLCNMPGVTRIEPYPCLKKKQAIRVSSSAEENWVEAINKHMEEYKVGQEPIYGCLIMSNREDDISEYTYELMIPII